MLPNYKEQWVVTINRKEFMVDEDEKPKLEGAMANGDRWFKTKKGNILSVSHIESVTLHDRQIKNQLTAPKEQYTPIPNEKFEKIKREALSKIHSI